MGEPWYAPIERCGFTVPGMCFQDGNQAEGPAITENQLEQAYKAVKSNIMRQIVLQKVRAAGLARWKKRLGGFCKWGVEGCVGVAFCARVFVP